MEMKILMIYIMCIENNSFACDGKTFVFDGDPNNAISPLSCFFGNLPSVFACLTPEQNKYFEGFRIVLKDDLVPNCSCCSEKKEIVIHTGYMEFLWLSIYASLSLYLQSPYSRRDSTDEELQKSCVLTWTEDVLEAQKRCFDIINEASEPWPECINMPIPTYDVKDGTKASMASDIMLYGLGFVLLHEMAHKMMTDAGEVNQGIQHEFHADIFAIHQYMSDEWLNRCICGNRRNAFGKKMFAMLSVGAMLIFLDQFRDKPSVSHPSGIRRFHNMLSYDTNIFDLDDEEEYEPNDADFDIRPSIGYASFVLLTYAQSVLKINSSELRQLRDQLVKGSYGSPLDLYIALKKLFQDNNK